MIKFQKQELRDHFIEFRNRCIISLLIFLLFCVISYFFAEVIYDFLLYPLQLYSEGSHRIIYTSPIEAFLTYIKLSLTLGLLFSFPFILWQFYLFLAPALYRKEKKVVLMIFIVSPILFFLGAFISYQFLLPIIFKFFLAFENINSNIPIVMEAKISEYFSFTIKIIFIFAILFQIPLFFLLLVQFDKITKESLKKFRKYYIILSFIIGAIITPPDIMSQVFIALLMIFFYEITILFIRNKTNSN